MLKLKYFLPVLLFFVLTHKFFITKEDFASNNTHACDTSYHNTTNEERKVVHNYSLLKYVPKVKMLGTHSPTKIPCCLATS